MRFARILRFFAIGFLTPSFCLACGFFWFLYDLQQSDPVPSRMTDLTVVLTGGSNRVHEGLALLAARRSPYLFISGVYPGVDAAEMVRLAGGADVWVPCCITLGYRARDTVGNAEEVAGFIHRSGVRSIRLVTSNYHMRRARLEFSRTMPSGLVIIPHPVVPDRADLSGRSLTLPFLSLAGWEYLKFLGALVRPWID